MHNVENKIMKFYLKKNLLILENFSPQNIPASGSYNYYIKSQVEVRTISRNLHGLGSKCCACLVCTTFLCLFDVHYFSVLHLNAHLCTFIVVSLE